MIVVESHIGLNYSLNDKENRTALAVRFFLSFVECTIIYSRAAPCRDGAAPCEKTISEGVFEQGLHAEVHGTAMICKIII